MSLISSRRFQFGLASILLSLTFLGCGDDGKTPPDTPRAKQDARPTDLFRARNLGRLHALRDTDEGRAAATPFLTRAVQLSKGALLDRLNLARVLLGEGGDIAEAGVQLGEARKQLDDSSGEHVVFYFLRGLLAKRQKDTEQAVRDLEKAARLHGRSHPQIGYQLAFARERANDLEGAVNDYRRLLKDIPKFRAAAYRLSRCLLGLKRPDEARSAQAVYSTLPEKGQLPTETCHLLEVARARAPRLTATQLEPLQWSEVGGDATAIPLARDGDGHVVFAEGASMREATAAIVADLDNNKKTDVIISGPDGWRVVEVGDGLTGWKARLPAVFESGISRVRVADIDHDGDLDILGMGSSGCVVARNNGDRTWTGLQPFDGIDPTEGGSFDVHDFDNQNDLDVVFPHQTDGVVCFLNQRDGTFRRVVVPKTQGTRVVASTDMNGDGAPDIFAAGESQWQLLINNDPSGRKGEASFTQTASGEMADLGPASAVLLHDVDADGFTDVVLGGEKGWRLLRNRTGAGLDPESIQQTPAGVRELAMHDESAENTPVLRVATANGEAAFHQPVGNLHRGIWVTPVGRRDNLNSIGARVELFDGTLYTSVMIKNSLGVRLGLGRKTGFAMDGLHVIWPQGIRQAVPTDSIPNEASVIRFKQKEGLVASCPFLYTLGDNGWQFVTDVVGIAPLDEWLPEGAKPVLDPEEFVRLPQEALAILEGRVKLSITEELRETTYLDRVELFWNDHDPASNPWLNESTAHGTYETLEPTWISRGSVGSVEAEFINEEGARESGTASLLLKDGEYLHSYRDTRPQWSGWVERHETLLTTKSPATHLLLDGRIAWYDSSISFSLSQMGKTWGPLQLFRLHANGERTLLVEDMGLPAGMDRTMVAQFAKTPLAAGTTLILSGQHRFLWDQVRTATAVSPARSRTFLSASPSSAQLLFHGFSAVSGDTARHEQTYDFNSPEPDDSFDRAVGMATRLGDVNPLLQHHDDQLVVLIAGDRCDLTFDVPDIKPGFRRTYFLKITGWAKEGSFHNKTGRTIAPLPFRSMKTYPPSASQEKTEPARAAYLATYQTRVVRR